jgi:hypothetical protein
MLSPASRTSTGLTSTPNDGATIWTAVPTRGGLRRSHPQGREARRPAGAGADHPRRRGDRVSGTRTAPPMCAMNLHRFVGS